MINILIEIYCDSSEDGWTNEDLRRLFLNQDQLECISSQSNSILFYFIDNRVNINQKTNHRIYKK